MSKQLNSKVEEDRQKDTTRSIQACFFFLPMQINHSSFASVADVGKIQFLCTDYSLHKVLTISTLFHMHNI